MDVYYTVMINVHTVMMNPVLFKEENPFGLSTVLMREMFCLVASVLPHWLHLQ